MLKPAQPPYLTPPSDEPSSSCKAVCVLCDVRELLGEREPLLYVNICEVCVCLTGCEADAMSHWVTFCQRVCILAHQLTQNLAVAPFNPHQQGECHDEVDFCGTGRETEDSGTRCLTRT